MAPVGMNGKGPNPDCGRPRNWYDEMADFEAIGIDGGWAARIALDYDLSGRNGGGGGGKKGDGGQGKDKKPSQPQDGTSQKPEKYFDSQGHQHVWLGIKKAIYRSGQMKR